MSDRIAPIEPEAIYPLALFEKLSGLGRDGLRVARRQGLTVRYLGGRGYIRGRDFGDYLDRHGRTSLRPEVANA